MSIKEFIKRTCIQTNDCIILTAPLIIFLSIIGWYINYARNAIDNIPKLTIAIITLLIMLGGFLSAWLYMAKRTLKIANKLFVFDKDRAKAMWDLILDLPRGIGKLFFPILGMISVYIIIYTIFFTTISYFISKYISPVDLSTLGISYAFVSSEEMFNEMLELPDAKLAALNCWYMSTFVFTLVISFFTLLWIPEIVYTKKNFLISFVNSIKKIFFNFKSHILMYSYIVFLYLLMCIINAFLMINPITYFFVLLISYYFIVYVVVLLFSYYETRFIDEE